MNILTVEPSTMVSREEDSQVFAVPNPLKPKATEEVSIAATFIIWLPTLSGNISV